MRNSRSEASPPGVEMPRTTIVVFPDLTKIVSTLATPPSLDESFFLLIRYRNCTSIRDNGLRSTDLAVDK